MQPLLILDIVQKLNFLYSDINLYRKTKTIFRLRRLGGTPGLLF